jgi:outer membrane immunogenic protein
MNGITKIILLGCAAAGALSCSANAADMTLKARPMAAAIEVYSWTGFYIGGHIGGGVGEDDPVSMQRFTGAGGVVPHPLQSGTFTDNNFAFGGAQAGYNQQFGSWVAGIEADISAGSRRDASIFLTEGPVGYTASRTVGPEWFGTVRGRLGYLFSPRTMGYVTGGLAYGETRPLRQFVTGPGPIGAFAFNTGPTDTRTGWTVGAGFEYMLAPKWSIKAEYQYIDLGNEFGGTNTIIFNGGNRATFTSGGDFRVHTGQIGVNYHFGGPVVASY